MHYRAISYINLPKTYDDSILAQFVVHHATDSNRTIRVECLRCHHTCQIFKCRFAVGQLSVNCWYTAGRQLADSIPTLGRQVFWGAPLHNYHNFNKTRINTHIFTNKPSKIQRLLKCAVSYSSCLLFVFNYSVKPWVDHHLCCLYQILPLSSFLQN